MVSLDTTAIFMDELLDFSSDIGEEEDDEDDTTKALTLPFPLLLPTRGVKTPGMFEEELEWISNKDAFPMVESLVGFIPSHNPHRSPVSVLDSGPLSLTGMLKVPVRARSKKRKRRMEFADEQHWRCWGKAKKQRSTVSKKSSILGRKCLHCQTEKTPQWRAGPMGPKTLCNACGVRYKSGRLVPEYRPASSPTFSSELHSNSHRKIVEMRKQKQVS